VSRHVGAPGGWELGPRRTGGKFIAQLSLVDSARAGFGALTPTERPRSKACAKQAPFHLVWGTPTLRLRVLRCRPIGGLCGRCGAEAEATLDPHSPGTCPRFHVTHATSATALHEHRQGDDCQ
jgi:hypothetical protein